MIFEKRLFSGLLQSKQWTFFIRTSLEVTSGPLASIAAHDRRTFQFTNALKILAIVVKVAILKITK